MRTKSCNIGSSLFVFECYEEMFDRNCKRKVGKEMINCEVTDRKLKKAILHEARRCGCDIDGDIISYEGNRYIVYLYTNTVIREER